MTTPRRASQRARGRRAIAHVGPLIATHDPEHVLDVDALLEDPTRGIIVCCGSGGVGKTTSTVNLAAALAIHGLKVLVIDLDPQGNASTALAVDHRSGTPSVYEVLIGEMSVAEAAQVSTASLPRIRSPEPGSLLITVPRRTVSL